MLLRHHCRLTSATAQARALIGNTQDGDERLAWFHADLWSEPLSDVVDTIEAATGQRPRGWLGPGLTETFNTPQLLGELSLSYVLDWTSDDQPFPLGVTNPCSS